MTGVVTEVNPARGTVAVKTEEGYSILEMLGDDRLEVGDHVRWSGDTPWGREIVENLTEHRAFEVYFENHQVSQRHVRAQLRY